MNIFQGPLNIFSKNSRPKNTGFFKFFSGPLDLQGHIEQLNMPFHEIELKFYFLQYSLKAPKKEAVLRAKSGMSR